MGLSFVAVNAGKQSVAIDFKAQEGKEVFLRLVEQADVVLENFRPKVMERLGLGYEVLASAIRASSIARSPASGRTAPGRAAPPTTRSCRACRAR